MARKRSRKSQRTGVRGKGPDGRSGWTEFDMLRQARERDDRRRRRERDQLLLPVVTRPGKPGINAAREVIAGYTKQRDRQRARAAGGVKWTEEGNLRQQRRSRVPTKEEICAKYRKDERKRREVMFATGSAGKGRRNTGPRQRSLLETLCK